MWQTRYFYDTIISSYRSRQYIMDDDDDDH